MPTIPHDLFRRFFDRVEKPSDPEACWRWTGYADADGYGMLWVKIGDSRPRNHRANRLSYLIHTGDIPDGMLICHTCDNPPCVNPSHLFLGTPRDNTLDMIEKGRGLVGSISPNAKLSEEQVAEIIGLLASGVRGNAIARQFDISKSVVSNINLELTWSGVDRPKGGTYSVTPKQADVIRIRFAQGVSATELAREFGVSAGTINRVVRGKVWPTN